MEEINNIEWEERKRMSDFLYKKGWQLTKNELWDVIQEYHLEEEWNKENLSTSHKTD